MECVKDVFGKMGAGQSCEDRRKMVLLLGQQSWSSEVSMTNGQ